MRKSSKPIVRVSPLSASEIAAATYGKETTGWTIEGTSHDPKLDEPLCSPQERKRRRREEGIDRRERGDHSIGNGLCDDPGELPPEIETQIVDDLLKEEEKRRERQGVTLLYPTCQHPLPQEATQQERKTYICQGKGCGLLIEVKNGKIRYTIGERNTLRWTHGRY